jgi:peptidoglycan/xylan/chitin deacetylase (PgdA/CDA1 family)
MTIYSSPRERIPPISFALVLIAFCYPIAFAAVPVPDKTVVLTFDDAVKSHIEVVAPLLKDHGFGATFFVTHLWMDDTERFMNWEDIAELHRMGFEIGNHSWTHPNFSSPKVAARLAGELALIDFELDQVGVPKPVSFAWTGNAFGPEAVNVLRNRGYTFARRGMQPEITYGEIVPGPLYDPDEHDQLLIPSAGDAYPSWTLEHFKRVVDRAKDGKIAVVQFHGVPDNAHPWVHTPVERFRKYMAYLKDGGFNVIAMRDLAAFIDAEQPVSDPMAERRYPDKVEDELELPIEMAATRQNRIPWSLIMQRHGYTRAEATSVFGYNASVSRMRPFPSLAGLQTSRILSYPGGRHPRIGFLDGAIDPQRGTKVSVFAPWEEGGYVVVDLPEAIFSNLGLTFLAHTHIPTIWDDEDVIIDNVDWARIRGGGLAFERELPNGIRFGAEVEPEPNGAALLLWLENGTEEPLTELRTQVCAMLKGAPGFTAQTVSNKTFRSPVAVAKAGGRDRYVLIAFDHCGRTWGNADCPCIHADPVLPDAAPGERVEVRGRIWFYEGDDVEGAIARAVRDFSVSTAPSP